MNSILLHALSQDLKSLKASSVDSNARIDSGANSYYFTGQQRAPLIYLQMFGN